MSRAGIGSEACQTGADDAEIEHGEERVKQCDAIRLQASPVADDPSAARASDEKVAECLRGVGQA